MLLTSRLSNDAASLGAVAGVTRALEVTGDVNLLRSGVGSKSGEGVHCSSV